MKEVATVSILFFVIVGLALIPSDAFSQTYVGEGTCIGCHSGRNPGIVAEYQKAGHRFTLNELDSNSPAAPTYPTGRLFRPLNADPVAPAAVEPPSGTAWADFAYVIGGYGWKARFVRPNGRIYTDDDQAQQNLFNNTRVAYHLGEDKKHNYSCFQCHTTGPEPAGSWNNVPTDSLGTFAEPGVRCEGCHGPGSDHVAGAFNVPPVLPPNAGEYLEVTRCGECHQRGGATNLIAVSGGFIRHHEQINEYRASRHGDGVGPDLTCISCHNPHVALHFPDVAGDGFDGISMTCESCHPNQEIAFNGGTKPIECVDCHMPKATKSALGFTVGNGYIGDVSTHIWAINTNPVTRDAMWNTEGTHVQLDGENLAAVTMDFACLQCHTDQDVVWAANYATVLHSQGIATTTDDVADLPKQYDLIQNYPNPFDQSTTIRFDLPETADVTLQLYSVDGRLVGTLLDQIMPAGKHSVELKADMLPSGTYVYRLNAGSHKASKTMTLIK